MTRKTMKENVEHPSHYRGDGKHEAIDVIRAWGLNFNLGNVVKYVCRAGLKSEETTLEDLEKAAFYLRAEIAHLQGSSDEGNH
jgi:hypothetical protein